MKATEVYRALRSALEPWFRENGFVHVRGARLVEQRRLGDLYGTIWFHCDPHGFDRYAGSSFRATFSLSSAAADYEIGSGLRRSEGLNFFLTDEELETARAYRDSIVARIPRPPESWFEQLEAGFRVNADAAARMIAAARAWFEPEPQPYTRLLDFRLRYWRPEDVSGWAAFLLPVLPRAASQMEEWAADGTRARNSEPAA